MKKLSGILTALALGLFLAACGGGSSDDNRSSTASASSAAASAASSSSEASSAASSSTASTATVTIHMLGDSTMTTYTEDRRPQMGWGEAMPQFFDSSATIKNWALGGRSSRSFYYESTRWPVILPQINAGDYVIIQFGHNDEKDGTDYATYGTYAYCSDGTTDGENCSGATDSVDTTVDKSEHSYYQFLKKYVTEIRARGATPILMSPIVRKYFSGTTITDAGQHNLTTVDSGETYARGNYTAAMKAVADTYSVPYVDLTAATKTIVESYGDSAAASYLYISTDSTHPRVLFANLIAKKAVEGLSDLGLLTDYMVPVTSLIASPSTLDWSTRYVGVASAKSVTVAAFDLSPAAGTVTLSSPSSNFLLSTDQSTWSQSLDIAYTNGAFTETVYVQFTPTDTVDYSQTLSFVLDSTTLGTIAVSGTGISSSGGVDSSSVWFGAGSSVAAVADGLLTGADAVASNLTAATSKSLTVGTDTVTAARFTVDTWTSHDSSKYLEFSVTPTGAFVASSISMYYASSGGSTIQCDIAYSTDQSTWTTLNGSTPLASVKDTLTLAEYSGLAVQVASGSPLYVRIYPWNTAGTSGKYLALYNVTIAGKVTQ